MTLEITVDGDSWHMDSEYNEYDAVHATAGALLAGADKVTIERVDAEN